MQFSSLTLVSGSDVLCSELKDCSLRGGSLAANLVEQAHKLGAKMNQQDQDHDSTSLDDASGRQS